MIELVLMYCLSSDTAQCVQPREVREARWAAPSSAPCGRRPGRRSSWSWHPRYRLSGWRCEVDKPRESPA